MADKPMATLGELEQWALAIIHGRHPDVVIGDPADPYMERWHVVPRNLWSNVYLHRILKSDDDRALHDHPWDNASLLIQGEYLEHTPGGALRRVAGDHVRRLAATTHRLELIGGDPVISLFTTGPKIREWGFWCPEGWTYWEQFEREGCA